MYKTISLNGEWILRGKDSQNHDIEIPVQVPGYAHLALEKAGILEPIYWRDNAEKYMWIENVEWCFLREFIIAEDVDISCAQLRFDSIDTFADIYLNGKLIHSTSNMFLNYFIPVNDVLKIGKNSLCVTIHPYKQMIKDKPDRNAAFSGDRVNVRRIQCTFFWDWVSRFVSSGIAGNVELAFPTQSVIEDVFVETMDICETSAALRVQLKTKNAVDNDCRFSVDIISPEGDNVWDLKGNVFMDEIYLQADIDEPRLWWPVGYGEHPLYIVKVILFDKNNNEIDKKTLRIGIRTVRFEMLRDKQGTDAEIRTRQLREKYNQLDNPRNGESFVLLVNGQRIFSKGGNWVPASPFPGTIPESHYRNLIELAAKSNMNLLRVWGGGIYEPDIFYDLCDELGVMVTQDFMLSCGDYPDEDPDFIDTFKKEVEAVILRLRSRTCLAAWLGNNENGDDFDWDDKNTKNIKLNCICQPILNKLNPNRTFRLYCPYGGIGNTDLTIGDDHLSWWWTGAENITSTSFDVVGRFASESALEGYPLPSSLRKFLLEEDILDFNNPMVDYHIKNNIYFDYMGLISVHDRLKKNSQIIVGDVDGKYEQLYRWAYIQYEWARLTLEGMRRSKWYGAGVLYWMYDDCWPALGYAVVDYYGRPKAGWYATKYSGAPIAATMKEKDGVLEFIVLNDSFETGQLSYSISIYKPENGFVNIGKGEAEFGSNVNTKIFDCTFGQLGITKESNAIVFFDIYKENELISRGRWYPDWLSKLNLPIAELEYTADRTKNKISVTCKKGVALGVAFDGEFVAEDNFIDLLEGETREIAYTAFEGFDEITVYGYNSPISKI